MMDRPYGIGCGVMLLVKTPARFHIGGRDWDITQKSMVILSPEVPHYYRALEGVYTDDWLYFTWEEGDRELFFSMGIPLNTPIPLRNPDELSQIFQRMAYENRSLGEYHQEISDLYMKILLYKLSWNAKGANERGGAISKKWTQKLIQVRNEIYNFPERIQDANYYAEFCGMSISGFQHAYKRLFDVNVMTDINNSRFEYAKQLLRATNMPIREIATHCGYQSEFSFMRQFKKQVGKTPTEYRKLI